MSNMECPLAITLSAEWAVFPLWVKYDVAEPRDNVPPPSLRDFGVSDDGLIAAIQEWDQEYQAVYRPDDPASSGFDDEGRTAAWLARGLELARELGRQLPARISLTYHQLGQRVDIAPQGADGEGGEPLRPPSGGLTSDVEYFARLAPGRTRANPSGVMRRRRRGDQTVDEVFTRNLRWEPTEYFNRYRLGHNDTEHEKISGDEAESIVRSIVAKRR